MSKVKRYLLQKTQKQIKEDNPFELTDPMPFFLFRKADNNETAQSYLDKNHGHLGLSYDHVNFELYAKDHKGTSAVFKCGKVNDKTTIKEAEEMMETNVDEAVNLRALRKEEGKYKVFPDTTKTLEECHITRYHIFEYADLCITVEVDLKNG